MEAAICDCEIANYARFLFFCGAPLFFFFLKIIFCLFLKKNKSGGRLSSFKKNPEIRINPEKSHPCLRSLSGDGGIILNEAFLILNRPDIPSRTTQEPEFAKKKDQVTAVCTSMDFTGVVKQGQGRTDSRVRENSTGQKLFPNRLASVTTTNSQVKDSSMRQKTVSFI